MPTIRIETRIKADIETCFDLSRSIDLHLESTKQTGETAVAGRTNGLIEMGDSVTWRAKHFGIWQTLTSKITVMQRPVYLSTKCNAARLNLSGTNITLWKRKALL